MADASNEVSSAEQLLARLEYEQAYKLFDRATKLDPGNASAYFGKAEAALGIPQVEAETILGLYKKAIELDPQNPQYLDAFASFCIDLGRFQEAEAAYNKAAELDPENAPFYYMDFAINYHTKAPQIMERFMDEKTQDIIRRKALDYLLKALGLPKDEARRLLT